MFALVSTLNDWSERWLTVMWAVIWQLAAVVAIATVLAWLLRRSSPIVRYWLWQIVAIKLLLMPFWTFAVPLPSWAEYKPAAKTTEFYAGKGLASNGYRSAFPSPLPSSSALTPPPRQAPRSFGNNWPQLTGEPGCCWAGASR